MGSCMSRERGKTGWEEYWYNIPHAKQFESTFRWGLTLVYRGVEHLISDSVFWKLQATPPFLHTFCLFAVYSFGLQTICCNTCDTPNPQQQPEYSTASPGTSSCTLPHMAHPTNRHLSLLQSRQMPQACKSLKQEVLQLVVWHQGTTWGQRSQSGHLRRQFPLWLCFLLSCFLT